MKTGDAPSLDWHKRQKTVRKRGTKPPCAVIQRSSLAGTPDRSVGKLADRWLGFYTQGAVRYLGGLLRAARRLAAAFPTTYYLPCADPNDRRWGSRDGWSSFRDLA